MEIILYKDFAKKDNSTLRPSGTGDSFSCYLKDNTSVTDPVIVLDLSDKENFTHYTYAYIPEYERYYFVVDMVADGLLWDIVLRCDVLATYKTEIGNSSLYVLRSAAASDGRIIDTYYPVMTYHTDRTTVHNNPMNKNSTTGAPSVDAGVFILGVVGQGSGDYNYGSIRYYVVTRSALNRIVSALLDDTVIAPDFDSDDMSLALQKSIIDPLSFIKSCIWLPVDRTLLTTQETPQITMPVFTWTLPRVACYKLDINPPQVQNSIDLTIAAHPLAASRGAYMNTEPFTRIQLVYPPFGAFELDTAALSNQSAVTCITYLDAITGMGHLKVRAKESGKILVNTQAQVGVQIQLSQVTKDIIGSAMQAAGAASDLFSFNFGGAAQNAIGSAVSAYKPLVSSIGGNGGFSDLNGLVELQQSFFYPVDEDNANAGRPLCEIRQLSTLPGYQKIMDGDVTIAGTAGEQAMIKSYLEGGYYYE